MYRERISRRRFLAATVGLLISLTGTAGAFRLRNGVPGRVDGGPAARLSQAERETVVALTRILYPTDDHSDSFVTDYIDELITERPPRLASWRRSIELLESAAQREFARSFKMLEPRQRNSVVEGLLHPPGLKGRAGIWRKLRRTLEPLWLSGPARELRQRVVRPLLTHYYRSPRGWAVVGYRASPGRPPADPLAYSQPLATG